MLNRRFELEREPRDRARPQSRQVLVGCAAVLVLSSVLATTWAAPDGGYVFSNLTVQPREGTPDAPGGRPDLTVGYATAWTGDEFPGWRACVIEVLGEDGAVIAEKTIEMFDVTRAPSSRSTEVEMLPGAEHRRPERVEGECSGPRLDEPDGEYEISDVRIRPDPMSPDDSRTFELSFDEAWTGGGVPGVETCVATVTDDSGETLFEHRFNFSDGRGGRDDAKVRIVTDEPVERDPVGAELVCGRFSP